MRETVEIASSSLRGAAQRQRWSQDRMGLRGRQSLPSIIDSPFARDSLALESYFDASPSNSTQSIQGSGGRLSYVVSRHMFDRHIVEQQDAFAAGIGQRLRNASGDLEKGTSKRSFVSAELKESTHHRYRKRLKDVQNILDEFEADQKKAREVEEKARLEIARKEEEKRRIESDAAARQLKLAEEAKIAEEARLAEVVKIAAEAKLAVQAKDAEEAVTRAAVVNSVATEVAATSSPVAIFTADNKLATFVKEALELKTAAETYRDGPLQALLTSTDPGTKRLRMDIKKQLNVPLNQLASTTQQIQQCEGKVAQALRALERLGSEQFRFGLTQFSSLILDTVSQMTAQPRSIWAYAKLLSSLLAGIPGLRPVFLGELMSVSLYVVPHFVRKLKTTSIEEFNKMRGQKPGEAEATFYERMVPFVRLRMALAVCENDVTFLWLWFARVLNATPRRVSAYLVLAGLEVSAHLCQKVFPRQLPKLLRLIRTTFLSKLQNVKSRANKDATLFNSLTQVLSRLCTLLEDCEQCRIIPPPDGSIFKMSAQPVTDFT